MPKIRRTRALDGHWRWPERNLAGNTTHFFVQVLGLSFHQAMREIADVSTAGDN
jgi:hypothetical protein